MDALAARTGGTAATARWDAGTVLAAVGALMDPALVARIIDGLPTGYALLFARSSPRQPERTGHCPADHVTTAAPAGSSAAEAGPQALVRSTGSRLSAS
ncbi:hypothetical protein SMICM304S_04230 [Streptomyces microflavus]